MTEKVVQLVAAPAGWRHVYAYLGESGDLETLPDNRLYGTTPIACWALCDDGETVRHVTPDDWPSYLAVSGDEEGAIGYLAPGEEPDHYYREEAIRQITDYRARQAKRTASAAAGVSGS